jgi:hypothetical protein
MKLTTKRIATYAVIGSALLVTGCETTNSIPYKASTTNVITIQQSMQSQGKKISVAQVDAAAGVDQNPTCRLMGPVTVAPGKSLAQYIKEAMTEELFMAQVYQPNAASKLEARIEELSFSSTSPAFWSIKMNVKSNQSEGYTVAVKYGFDTSWSAQSACKNVADAFGPAVQELLKQVVTDPKFASLTK